MQVVICFNHSFWYTGRRRSHNVHSNRHRRFDRSSWNYWNQTEESAAPKQSWHNGISRIDSKWKTLPLETGCDCEQHERQVLAHANTHIPHVLRHQKRTLVRSLSDTSTSLIDAHLEEKRQRVYDRLIPTQKYVTAGLYDDQARELLHIAFQRRFVCTDPNDVPVLNAYMLHGYTSRMFGPYKQEALFVGRGRGRREFKNMPQYNVDSLSIKVLNRIYQTDGSLKGTSKRPSRSTKLSVAIPRTMHNEEKYTDQLLKEPEYFVEGNTNVMMSPEGSTAPASTSSSH